MYPPSDGVPPEIGNVSETTHAENGHVLDARGVVMARLLRARSRGKLGHTLLLSGGGGHGGYDVALRLARSLLGLGEQIGDSFSALFNHADFLCASPLPPQTQRVAREDGLDPVPGALVEDPFARLDVGANWGITADQARAMIQWAAMTPWQAACKVCLIAEADSVNEATADILLKTLEEPPDDVTIILVTSRPQDLLPTVRSRCHETRIPPMSDAELVEELVQRGADAADAQAVVPLAQGDLWRAGALLEGESNRLRTSAGELLQAALDPKRKVADVMGETREIVTGLNAGEAGELVRWFIWWLRDLILAAEGVQPAHRDMDSAAGWAAKVGRRRLTQWIEEADRGHEMLGRNVTPSAVVAALALFPRDQRRMGSEPTFPALSIADMT